MIFRPLSMALDFIGKKKKDIPCSDANVVVEEKKPDPPIGPLSVEDPRVARVLKEFFDSHYWGYIRDLIFQEITVYQIKVDKSLQGALADPLDSNGKVAAFHGGRLKAGEEIKLILERLKKNHSR